VIVITAVLTEQEASVILLPPLIECPLNRPDRLSHAGLFARSDKWPAAEAEARVKAA
jgi:hypothetical protein